jgi:wyosine [tRNA(Phe)-imidazoG37] synthetase (radical SAM superfamily)
MRSSPRCDDSWNKGVPPTTSHSPLRERPTLNSKLGEIIGRVKVLTDIPVAVLTNGTLFHDPDVRKELRHADVVLPSMDAASEAVFRRINRPHGRLRLEEILAGLMEFRKEYHGQIWLEILFVKGINDSREEIRRLRRMAERIRPDRIHLNTVVRLPAESGVSALSHDELEAIREVFGPTCAIA